MKDTSRRVPVRTLEGEPIEGVEHLICIVCGYDRFKYHESWGTRYLAMQHANLSGAKPCYGYACNRCGFIHSFAVKR